MTNRVGVVEKSMGKETGLWGKWGPQGSTNSRDEPQKDTDLPIIEEATAGAAE